MSPGLRTAGRKEEPAELLLHIDERVPHHVHRERLPVRHAQPKRPADESPPTTAFAQVEAVPLCLLVLLGAQTATAAMAPSQDEEPVRGGGAR